MRKLTNLLFFYGCFQLMASEVAYAQDPTPPTAEEIRFTLLWLEEALATDLTDEDIIFAAMLAQQRNPSLVPRLLGKELASGEANRLRLNLAILYSASAAAADFCLNHSFVEQLKKADPDNIEPWLYALDRQIRIEDKAGAFSALVEGLKTGVTNDYYLEKLKISRQKLKEIAYPADRINEAAEEIAFFEFIAMYYRILALCPEQNLTSSDWKVACLALGLRLEESGKTVLANMIGFGLQRDILKTNSTEQETLELNAVQERRAAPVLVRDTLPLKVDWCLNRVATPDSFYEDVFQSGEMPAMKRLLESYE